LFHNDAFKNEMIYANEQIDRISAEGPGRLLPAPVVQTVLF